MLDTACSDKHMEGKRNGQCYLWVRIKSKFLVLWMKLQDVLVRVREMLHLYCQAESLCYPSYHIMTDSVHITYKYVQCIFTGMIILCNIYNTNSFKLFFLLDYTFYISQWLSSLILCDTFINICIFCGYRKYINWTQQHALFLLWTPLLPPSSENDYWSLQYTIQT